jgi:hypothetical protein
MDQGTAFGRAACPSHGQPPFPYAFIRHFSAVYERKAVRFVRDGIVSSPRMGPCWYTCPLPSKVAWTKAPVPWW